MVPSGTLFLDRDDVYQDKRARYRAYALYDLVLGQVEADLAGETGPSKMAFLKEVPNDQSEDEYLKQWYTVAEVAEAYPRLLVWLAEGKVRGLHNVFGLLVAVARLVPGLRWVLWRIMFRKVADRAPWRHALYEAVRQRHLLEKNEKAKNPSVDPDMFDTTMQALASEAGLASAADVTVPVRRRSRDDLHAKVVHMSSGCIGVSGVRGSGKSTLISDLCQHRYGTPEHLPKDENYSLAGHYRGGPQAGGAKVTAVRGLRLVVHAPLRFDAREFVIHLYTALADAVLADPWFNRPSFGGNVVGPLLLADSGRLTPVLGGLSVLVFLSAAVVLGYYSDTHHWLLRSWVVTDWRDWLALAVAAVLTVVALSIVLRRTRNAVLEVRQVIHLAVDARNRLRQLHYQRTYTLNRGGSLNAPGGAGLTLGDSKALAEQAMTLPELIDDFRDFAERVVASLYEKEAEKEDQEDKRQQKEKRERKKQGKRLPEEEPHQEVKKNSHRDVRLIIGIDEMDHIAETDDACKFLDEISALFGTVGCVFLVAVSPHTLAALDQRAVPVKTSSGGLFDEMIWIDPLPFHDATTFVNSWVSGMPLWHAGLCYVLSGGLPRELSRITRAVVTAADDDKKLTLERATRRVTNGEIVAYMHRAMASAVSLDNGAAFALLTPLTRLLIELTGWDQPTDDANLPDQKELIAKVSEEATRRWTHFPRETAPVTREIVHSFIAGLYFLLTVRVLFERGRDEVAELLLPDPKRPWRYPAAYVPDPAALRELVNARGALNVSPQFALALVKEAWLELRSDHDGTTDQALAGTLVMPNLRLGQ
jgi:hypothetical protein